MKREIEYLVLDLLIQKAAAAYRVQVLDSPAGQASVDFSLPFSSLEIENYLLRFNRQQGGVRRIDSPELKAAKTFGAGLFRAVFQGEVLGCLRGSLSEADRQEKGLRIRLRLTEVPELIDLPWELLHDPSPVNKFLALSDRTPVVRYLDLPESVRALQIKPPLRVLVVISSPTGYPRLDTEGEWQRLSGALQYLEQSGHVALERLDEATLPALQQRLRQRDYHVFHFIGHGGFDPSLQDGVLLFEDEQERGRSVSGQSLGVLFQSHRSIRLALLNACEGGRASTTDPFGGTAQSLVQQGTPSVIAMQFQISDEAALTFASEFYRALADGYPVDAALGQSRQAIYLLGLSVEWATPVLYLRTPDGRIFDIERTGLETPQTVEGGRPVSSLPTSVPQRRLLPAKTLWAIVASVLAAAVVIYGLRQRPRETPSLPTVSLFEAKPASIRRGERAELSWKTKDAVTISISEIGRMDVPSGSTSVAPGETTTYTLTAENALGPVEKELTLTVFPGVGVPTPAIFPTPVDGQFGSFSNFRVIAETPRRLSFSVDYHYTGAFGIRMDLSASDEADESIRMLLPRPRVGQGSGSVTFELAKEGVEQVTSRIVRVCMVEPLTRTELHCQDFPYEKTWR